MTFKCLNIRNLFIESMGFEGVFKTIKDYVQPIAMQMVLALPIIFVFKDKAFQTTLVVYSIYFLSDIFAVFASRYSHYLSTKLGGDDNGCQFIWRLSLVLFSFLTFFLYFELYMGAIIAFIGLHILQNLWRPMLISRFDSHSRAENGATILSIESQAKSLFTVVAAPLVGFAVDLINQGGVHRNFWPVAAPGLVIGLIMISMKYRMGDNAS